jgi:hypothetical protein
MKRGPTGQHEIAATGDERVFAYTSYLAILNEETEPLWRMFA